MPTPAAQAQALVSFKKYMPPPLQCFKVNICPFPLLHFASIFFAYLWSFRWLNYILYIVTLPRYFSFRLSHLNISTGPPSDKLDENRQRMWLIKNFSHWNGYTHFRSGLRERPFNLKGEGCGFFLKKIFWFPMLSKKIFCFWWRKKKIWFRVFVM
jgi:hypothetical protein